MKLLFVTIFFFFFLSFSAVAASFTSQKFNLDKQNLGGGSWVTGMSQLDQAPSPAMTNGTIVLAATRTQRPDITRGFKLYRGGWNISNHHYWASVGFTGSAGIILALLWFVSFGIALASYHCCRGRLQVKNIGSKRSLQIRLILLIVFTCIAAIGCILLSVGQSEFHGEGLRTLNYVVNQSDYTVQTLRNVTEYLSLARDIDIDQFFMSADVKDDIDKLNVDLNSAADTLTEKTKENSGKIRKVFNCMQLILIIVAAVMLFVAILGPLISICRRKRAIYIFILSGWLLVAVMLVLCGAFSVLNNATSDACMAMEEWVENPQAETALSNILPCVDPRTTNKTLIQSKVVINQIVSVVNNVIVTLANRNPSPWDTLSYYNQSGPMVPIICLPFDSELNDRVCQPQEVSLANASLVWENYTCTVTPSGLCNSVGRLTPDIYSKFVDAVKVSFVLDRYTPPLLSLQNCNFVRETFRTITSDYCPPLERFLHMVVAGLGLISAGVLLCLVLWIIYANLAQRDEVFAKPGIV